MLALIRHGTDNLDVVTLIVGLLVAVLVFLVAEWLLGMIGFVQARAVAGVLAVLVFLAYVF